MGKYNPVNPMSSEDWLSFVALHLLDNNYKRP